MALTPLALAVLNLLHEQPAHPYQLHQTMNDRGTDRFVKVTAGTLYHTVQRLHRLGLVQPMATARAGRRPERTVYALTRDGCEQFHSELRAALRHPVREYPTFGSVVEMLRALAPEDVVDLLEFRAINLEADIAGYQQADIGLTRRGLPRIDLIEIGYATTLLRAELGWVVTLIDEIRSGALHWSARNSTGCDQHPTNHQPPTDDQQPTDHDAPERPTR